MCWVQAPGTHHWGNNLLGAAVLLQPKAPVRQWFKVRYGISTPEYLFHEKSWGHECFTMYDALSKTLWRVFGHFLIIFGIFCVFWRIFRYVRSANRIFLQTLGRFLGGLFSAHWTLCSICHGARLGSSLRRCGRGRLESACQGHWGWFTQTDPKFW